MSVRLSQSKFYATTLLYIYLWLFKDLAYIAKIHIPLKKFFQRVYKTLPWFGRLLQHLILLTDCAFNIVYRNNILTAKQNKQ